MLSGTSEFILNLDIFKCHYKTETNGLTNYSINVLKIGFKLHETESCLFVQMIRYSSFGWNSIELIKKSRSCILNGYVGDCYRFGSCSNYDNNYDNMCSFYDSNYDNNYRLQISNSILISSHPMLYSWTPKLNVKKNYSSTNPWTFKSPHHWLENIF